MKIKTRVRIGANIWKIKLIDGLAETQDKRGLCNDDAKVILIEKNLDEKTLVETLLHEIFHACQYETGMYQGCSEQLLEIDAESKARMLAQIFSLKFK